MKEYIGIQPDHESRLKIAEVVEELSTAFASQEIPFVPVGSGRYFIEIVDLGKKLNIIKRFSLIRKVTKVPFYPIKISFDSVKLGLSKKDKGIVVFTINDGAEELRHMLLQFMTILKIKREKAFIPHLAVGRINKDLSAEELRNINFQLKTFKSLNINNLLQFTASALSTIELKNGAQLVARNLPTASSASS